MGQVTETLPAGFSYVDRSVVPSDITVTETGQKVTFDLVGERSFTYKVTAPGTAGPHEFSGELTYGIEKNKVPIRATSVTVQQVQSGVSATRSFNPSPVPAGGEVTVTIASTANTALGQWSETLPAGFTYVVAGCPVGHNRETDRPEGDLSTLWANILHLQGDCAGHGRATRVLR